MSQTVPILRSPVFLMALTVFLDFTGLTLVIPLLPFWAQHLGANAELIGALSSSYALAQIVCTPLLGALSDRFGRKQIIVGSVLLEVLSFGLTALAGSLPLLFVARFIGGIGASNLGSAQAVITDVTPVSQRAQAMGRLGAAIGLAHVVGPALGGFLAIVGAAVPFWVACAVAALNAVLVWLFLPETTPGVTRPAREATQSMFNGLRQLFRQPGLIRLILVQILFTLAFLAMETVFTLFTQQRFGWAALQNGWVFAGMGAVMVLMQAGGVGWLVKHLGEQRLLRVGLFLVSAGFLLLPWSHVLALLIFALGLISFGTGAVNPMLSTLLSFVSPQDRQGETLGLAQGLTGIGRLVGPLLAGSLFVVGDGFPFLLAGVLCLVSLALLLPPLPARDTPTSPELVSQNV